MGDEKQFLVEEIRLLKTQKSKALYERAKRVLPAGVSYILRFMEPYPFYTAFARGSKLLDVDGNEYIDFWMGHHALILCHNPPQVIKAVRQQLGRGTHFGTSHELEVALAEQTVKMIPSVDMVRFTNSGTEANMYAARLVRTYTGREKIAKFEGGWHGGYDALHKSVKAPFDVPESGGYYEGKEYTVQVKEIFKGKPNKKINIFSENTSGRFPMEIGKTYVIFLHQELGRYQIDNCGNSGLLSEKQATVKSVRQLRETMIK